MAAREAVHASLERAVLDMIADAERERDAAGRELSEARRDLAAVGRVIALLHRRLAAYRLTYRDVEVVRARDAMRAMWGGQV